MVESTQHSIYFPQTVVVRLTRAVNSVTSTQQTHNQALQVILVVTCKNSVCASVTLDHRAI